MLDPIRRFGDRTSSFLTRSPGFESFPSSDHNEQIRFTRTKRHWVAATEPLTTPERRAQLFLSFASAARADRKRALILPISRELAEAIRELGGDAVAIGQEPVFVLDRYFVTQNPVPGRRLRAELSIEELTGERLQARASEIEALAQEWRSSRSGPELGFLNRVEPLEYPDEKRFFAAIDHQDRIQALATAVPVARTSAWYFAEVLRHPHARAGTMEKLLIESMRLLWKSGAQEVRLGLCPATGLKTAQDWRARWLERLAPLAAPLYRARGARDFKEKLKPTAWITLYAASDVRLGLWALQAALRAHLGQETLWATLRRFLTGRLTPFLNPSAIASSLPTRPRIIPVLAVGASILQALRATWAPMAKLHAEAAYRPGALSPLGLALHPLLHTSPGHFFGNLLSLLFFGLLGELLLPRRTFALALVFGLWASNPLTHAVVSLLIPFLRPEAWVAFQNEWDYGASNGVYALVGAFATLLKSPRAVLIPFLLNGAFLCIALQSWLSLHHLIALLGGYALARMASKAPPSVSSP